MWGVCICICLQVWDTCVHVRSVSVSTCLFTHQYVYLCVRTHPVSTLFICASSCVHTYISATSMKGDSCTVAIHLILYLHVSMSTCVLATWLCNMSLPCPWFTKHSMLSCTTTSVFLQYHFHMHTDISEVYDCERCSTFTIIWVYVSVYTCTQVWVCSGIQANLVPHDPSIKPEDTVGCAGICLDCPENWPETRGEIGCWEGGIQVTTMASLPPVLPAPLTFLWVVLPPQGVTGQRVPDHDAIRSTHSPPSFCHLFSDVSALSKEARWLAAGKAATWREPGGQSGSG